MPPKPPKFTREDAEALALRAVAVIAGDDDLFPTFLAVTGSDPNDLRQRVDDPQFLGAVLDFVLETDATVHMVAVAAGVPSESILVARSLLPCGPVDWNP
jgi:hypothetical protein